MLHQMSIPYVQKGILMHLHSDHILNHKPHLPDHHQVHTHNTSLYYQGNNVCHILKM